MEPTHDLSAGCGFHNGYYLNVKARNGAPVPTRKNGAVYRDKSGACRNGTTGLLWGFEKWLA
jgi:hypothetical protein